MYYLILIGILLKISKIKNKIKFELQKNIKETKGNK